MTCRANLIILKNVRQHLDLSFVVELVNLFTLIFKYLVLEIFL